MTVPAAVQVEIPCRYQQQACACLAVAAGEWCEVHVFADGYAPGFGTFRQEGECLAGLEVGFKWRQHVVLVVELHWSAWQIDACLVVLQRLHYVDYSGDYCGLAAIGEGLEDDVG